METKDLIAIPDFCEHYKIEISFIDSLNQFGLIEIITVEKTQFIHEKQLRDVEKMIRLHYDLEINLEGIDAISHLLKRVDSLQEELNILRNKIRSYENDNP